MTCRSDGCDRLGRSCVHFRRPDRMPRLIDLDEYRPGAVRARGGPAARLARGTMATGGVGSRPARPVDERTSVHQLGPDSAAAARPTPRHGSGAGGRRPGHRSRSRPPAPDGGRTGRLRLGARAAGPAAVVGAGERVPGGHVDRRPGRSRSGPARPAAGSGRPAAASSSTGATGWPTSQRLQALQQERGRLQGDGGVAEHVAGADHALVREQVGEDERELVIVPLAVRCGCGIGTSTVRTRSPRIVNRDSATALTPRLASSYDGRHNTPRFGGSPAAGDRMEENSGRLSIRPQVVRREERRGPTSGSTSRRTHHGRSTWFSSTRTSRAGSAVTPRSSSRA